MIGIWVLYYEVPTIVEMGIINVSVDTGRMIILWGVNSLCYFIEALIMSGNWSSWLVAPVFNGATGAMIVNYSHYPETSGSLLSDEVLLKEMIFFGVFYAIVTIIGFIIGANLRKIGSSYEKRITSQLSENQLKLWNDSKYANVPAKGRSMFILKDTLYNAPWGRMSPEYYQKLKDLIINQISPELFQQFIDFCNNDINNSTADEKAYAMLIWLYFDGIGVHQDHRKSLEYTYKLIRINPEVGVDQYISLLSKDISIAELRGIHSREEEIQRILSLIVSIEILQVQGIETTDPEEYSKAEEMIHNLPSIKASLKDLIT